jgi:hypothetical protein
MCVYKWFGTTPRWTTPKWRHRADAPDLRFDPIRSVADLRQGLQRIAVCEYLADEPVLRRIVLPDGHFSIGGDRKRVVILGLLTDGHGWELQGDLRAYLLSLVTVETPEYTRLAEMP